MLNDGMNIKMKDDHYDIYVYKDWTLREWQQPILVTTYDPITKNWKDTKSLKTHIVWGIHQPCGLRGVIMITTGKADCGSCGLVMPKEVFINLNDALTFMRDALENPAHDKLL